MIVISGALVLVALVLLVMGVVGAELLLVYASIAVSTLSLLCLVVGILQRRGEPSSSQDGDDLVPVEVPASTSVRSGSVAVAERHEDASTTRTLSHDLLASGRGDEGDHAPDAVEDEQRWQADLDDGPEDDAQDEDARPAAGVRLVRLPQHSPAAQPQDEDVQDEQPYEDEDEDEDEPDEDEPDQREPDQDERGEDEEPRATVRVVPGRPRYHVEGCRYLYGKQPLDLELGEARDNGFVACGVCKPDATVAEPAALTAPPVEDEQRDQQQADQQVEEPLPQEDGPMSLEETLFGEPVFGEAGTPQDSEEPAPPVTTADSPAAPSDPSQEQSRDEPAPEQDAVTSLPESGPPASTVAEERPDDAEADAAAAVAGTPDEQSAATTSLSRKSRAKTSAVKRSPASKSTGKETPATSPATSSPATEPAGERPLSETSAEQAPTRRKAPAQKAPASKAPSRKAPTPTPAPASTTPGVRRIRAVGAAPSRAAGGVPAVRRVSATGAARPAPAPSPSAPAAQTAPARRTGQVVVVPDRPRFHRGECRFVQGVPGATSLSRAAAGRQGYSPCGVCKP